MARARGLIALALAGVAASPTAPDPVRALAGRYSAHFGNAFVSGERYESDNVVEIVPVDATHAYVRLDLQFANGHTCGLWGVAARQGNALVYRALANDHIPDRPSCRLTVRRASSRLAWDDGGGTCAAHCGARGTFQEGWLPWASKRPIRYLPRLRASSEYRDAVSQWRTGEQAAP